METNAIRKVHVVFKTHLDIGFTDLAHTVVEEYVQHFIPKALHTAEILARSDRPEQFVWTVSAWLVQTALELAAPTQRQQLEQALHTGQLIWHALPFTPHSEVMGAALFREGLRLSQDLDARFGRTTIAAKTTDVPGNTRAIVPLLAEAGVRLLHVGVNGAVALPEVPAAFRWRDPAGAELIVLYSGEYGGITLVPGHDEALAVEFTRDNLGPPSAEAVVLTFRQLAARFPRAQIVASSLDSFARSLITHEIALPIVTKEIGDTWIHGVGSDPTKVSRFRELSRLQSEWLRAGRVDEAGLRPARRKQILVAEHTWGLDTLAHLGDAAHYTAATFQEARERPNFQAMERSWAEQRQYLDDAVALLPPPLGQEATERLSSLRPRRLDLTGWQSYEPTHIMLLPRYEIGFSPQTGALTHFLDRANGKQWATPEHPLALLSYATFSAADHQQFVREYIREAFWEAWWVGDLFTRPEGASQHWQAQLQQIFYQTEEDASCWALELALPLVAQQEYGAPSLITVELRVPYSHSQLHVDVQWFEKPACRMAEAVWLSFQPLVAEPARWRLDKLGQAIDPCAVVARGARTLHAIEQGVAYSGADGSLRVDSLDAPLVAPGAPVLLRFADNLPQLAGGMHFNLHNNIWNTNYPLWFAEDARFRFTLQFDEHEQSS